jgi:hypothetical protein
MVLVKRYTRVLGISGAWKKPLPYARSLCHAIGNGPILGLDAQAGDYVLMLLRSVDEVVAEEHNEA